MRTVNRAIGALALGVLWWATAGSSGGCGCGSGNSTPNTSTPPPFDMVWCAIQATECSVYMRGCFTDTGTTCLTTGACVSPCLAQDTGCDSVPCTTSTQASCNANFATCDLATCTTAIASAPVQGDPQCFDH